MSFSSGDDFIGGDTRTQPPRRASVDKDEDEHGKKTVGKAGKEHERDKVESGFRAGPSCKAGERGKEEREDPEGARHGEREGGARFFARALGIHHAPPMPQRRRQAWPCSFPRRARQ